MNLAKHLVRQNGRKIVNTDPASFDLDLELF
jgi:hypothetical protein